MDPSKYHKMTQQQTTENSNDDSKSRLYHLGMLCASPGIAKDNLSHEMLSNLDKSNMIRNDQRRIISAIHTDKLNDSNKLSLPITKIKDNSKSTSQTETNESSDPSLSSTNTSNASSTTESNFGFHKTTKSLKRKKVPPPLDLSNDHCDKSSNNNETENPKRFKYFISTTTNNNNNNKDNNESINKYKRIKSAPSNILQFPHKDINPRPETINQENDINTYYERSNPLNIPDPYLSPFQPQINPICPSNIPYPYPLYMLYPYTLSNIPPPMFDSAGYSYYNNHIPYPYNMAPYTNFNKGLNNLGDPNRTKPSIKKPNDEILEESHDDNGRINGDVRIMNDVFTFEFLDDKKMSKDIFLSICSKVWDESIGLRQKREREINRRH